MERIDRVLAYGDSYKIIQNDDSFNFSIDSTMLAFYSFPKKKVKRILDIGSGSGIIELLLRYMTDSYILGVEIDKDSCSRSRRSIELNGLKDITIENIDIKNLRKELPQATFDMVISNPPYFRLEDSKDKNLDLSVRAARHEVYLTFDELAKEASYHLTDKGSFFISMRTDRLIEVLDTLRSHRLFPKRVRFLYPEKDKNSHIFLLESVKNGSSHGLVVEEPLYLKNIDGSYTEEVNYYFHYKENEKK